jgi:hypothetical protein
LHIGDHLSTRSPSGMLLAAKEQNKDEKRGIMRSDGKHMSIA